MSNIHPEQELVRQIELLSGQKVTDCYQCGACTSGCPVAEFMDVPPSKAMRLLQLGSAGELLTSHGIWMCASCLVCGARCPRGVDYARVAEACRAVVLRARNSKLDPDMVSAEECEEIPQQAFIAAFRKFAG